MERYKTQLLALKDYSQRIRNIEAAGIISSYYKELSKQEFGVVDDSLIVVGGLNACQKC